MFVATVFTLYPDLFPGPFSEGLYGKALEKKIWNLQKVNLRDYAEDKHKTVDDTPYGGGPGMVLKAEPFMQAVSHIKSEKGVPESVVLLSPQGRQLSQAIVERMSVLRHIVLLCGRYEEWTNACARI